MLEVDLDLASYNAFMKVSIKYEELVVVDHDMTPLGHSDPTLCTQVYIPLHDGLRAVVNQDSRMC